VCEQNPIKNRVCLCDNGKYGVLINYSNLSDSCTTYTDCQCNCTIFSTE